MEHEINPQNNDLVARAEKMFQDVGLVYFANTGLSEFSDMSALTRIIIKEFADYSGGAG
jgi:hypothetical protein